MSRKPDPWVTVRLNDRLAKQHIDSLEIIFFDIESGRPLIDPFQRHHQPEFNLGGDVEVPDELVQGGAS